MKTTSAVATRARSWRIRTGPIALDKRPLVMGILNVTPDSFSDGGRFFDRQAAVAHAQAMVLEGADLIDVGGESTRPGSDPVLASEEARRVLPVLSELARRVDVPLSVDTRKAAVAEPAIEAGAAIVNDVSALSDPQMAPLAARTGAGLVLMHMTGDPKTMQVAPHYDDVVRDVRAFLQERIRIARQTGVPTDAIAIDPGLGFGKRTGAGIEDNATLLRRLGELVDLGHPVLVGASRKSFIGNILGVPMKDRLEGSLAAAAVATWNGAHILRVHEVRQTRRVVDLVNAIRSA